jgi:hypothetical protein
MLAGTLTSLLLAETAKDAPPEKLDVFSVTRQVAEAPALICSGEQETSFGWSGISWILVETLLRAACAAPFASDAVN